jgi:cytochrome c oxidase subunit 1/cytochrome c oxidase subunit I+III
LVTRVVDSEPDHIEHARLPTIMPVVTAVATAALIIACLFTPWGLPVGITIVSITLFVWFWPTDRDPAFDTRERSHREARPSEGQR